MKKRRKPVTAARILAVYEACREVLAAIRHRDELLRELPDEFQEGFRLALDPKYEVMRALNGFSSSKEAKKAKDRIVAVMKIEVIKKNKKNRTPPTSS